MEEKKAPKLENEKLIALVRKYEFLYNTKHPKYMDNMKKNMAWKDIGKELNQSPAFCKRRWQGLRDAHRRALKKKKSAKKKKNLKPWTYEEEMEFMAPFYSEKRTYDTDKLSDDTTSDKSDDLSESHQDEETNFEDTYNDTITIEVPDPLSYSKQTEGKTKKDTTKEEQNSTKENELDRFFLSISDIVKKFPPYTQAVAKNKIFSLVSEMELKQLAPSSSSYLKEPPAGDMDY